MFHKGPRKSCLYLNADWTLFQALILSVVSVWYLNGYGGWVALPQAADGEVIGRPDSMLTQWSLSAYREVMD